MNINDEKFAMKMMCKRKNNCNAVKRLQVRLNMESAKNHCTGNAHSMNLVTMLFLKSHCVMYTSQYHKHLLYDVCVCVCVNVFISQQ